MARTRADLIAAIRSGGRWAFPAPAAEFNFFARGVWARGSCLCVVEELASVTGTAKALGTWHLILTQGRGYGIRTVGVAQRAAEVDKTIIGNATLIRVHRLTRAVDRKYMAAELDVDPREVDALQGFDYIERHIATGQIVRKKVRK